MNQHTEGEAGIEKAAWAGDIEGIKQQLRERGTLAASNGEVYSADHWTDMIDKVSSGERNFNSVTKNEGLRDAVMTALGVGRSEDEAGAGGSFDVTRALNSPGFTEFLAEFPDIEVLDPNNSSEIEARFQAFTKKEFAAQEMHALLEKEFTQEGMPEVFGGKEMTDAVGERIKELAIENPDKVAEIATVITEYRQMQRRTEETEAQLKELAVAEDAAEYLASLEEKIRVLYDARDTVGLVANTSSMIRSFGERALNTIFKEALATASEIPPGSLFEMAYTGKRAARETVSDEYGIELNAEAINAELAKVTKEAETLEANIAAAKELEEAFGRQKDLFEGMRRELLGGAVTTETMKLIAQRKAMQQLDGLLEEDPEKAWQYFEKLQALSKSNDVGVDYFDKQDESVIAKEIEQAIERRIAADVSAVASQATLGLSAYNSMHAALKTYLEKQNIGSQRGAEARSFIAKVLVATASEVSANGDRGRGFLIRTIAAKLSA